MQRWDSDIEKRFPEVVEGKPLNMLRDYFDQFVQKYHARLKSSDKLAVGNGETVRI